MQIHLKLVNRDSQVISFLRFPMIIGIVLIHSGIEMDYNFSEYVIYDIIVTKGIIGILSRVCVPLFFMISGYLFFYNVKLWNAKTYIFKLKRRGRSLLVPYLFWNTLAIVLFGLIGLIKPNLQSGATPPLQTWNLHVVASLYWSKSPDHIPIVPQFWFIRNLMVVVLFSPVIYWLVKYFNFLLPLVMGLLWLMNIGDWDVPGTMCLFFFSLGAWFSIRKLSYVQVGTQLKYIGWLYPVFVVADFLTIGTSYNSYIHKVGILSGIIFWIWLLNKWLTKHENVKPKALLLESTFFIFAAHEPYMGKFKTICYHILPQISENHIVSDLQFVLYYFLIAAIWIAILIGIYGLIRKMSPKLAMFISGGR